MGYPEMERSYFYILEVDLSGFEASFLESGLASGTSQEQKKGIATINQQASVKCLDDFMKEPRKKVILGVAR